MTGAYGANPYGGMAAGGARYGAPAMGGFGAPGAAAPADPFGPSNDPFGASVGGGDIMQPMNAVRAAAPRSLVGSETETDAR